MQGRDVATAPAHYRRPLTIDGRQLLTCRYLGGTVGPQRSTSRREALSDEGVNVDAEVGPALASDQGVWHLDLVLRDTQLAYIVQKTNLAPTLCTFIYRLNQDSRIVFITLTLCLSRTLRSVEQG